MRNNHLAFCLSTPLYSTMRTNRVCKVNVRVMRMTTLEYGQIYHQNVYADPKLTMSSLKPMVYLGKNFFGAEKEDTHYFRAHYLAVGQHE